MFYRNYNFRVFYRFSTPSTTALTQARSRMPVFIVIKHLLPRKAWGCTPKLTQATTLDFLSVNNKIPTFLLNQNFTNRFSTRKSLKKKIWKELMLKFVTGGEEEILQPTEKKCYFLFVIVNCVENWWDSIAPFKSVFQIQTKKVLISSFLNRYQCFVNGLKMGGLQSHSNGILSSRDYFLSICSRHLSHNKVSWKYLHTCLLSSGGKNEM